MKNENLLDNDKNLDNGKNENDKEQIVISLATLRHGKIVMTILLAVLIIIEFTTKDGLPYNLLAMYFGYLLTETFYRFKARKDKLDLFTLIMYLLFIIFNIFLYITIG